MIGVPRGRSPDMARQHPILTLGGREGNFDFKNEQLEGEPLDIVIVHGICDDWGSENETISLLQELHHDTRYARVTNHRYDAMPVFSGSWRNFESAVNELLDRISACHKAAVPPRPLLMICHGMGGLIAEAAINRTKDNPLYPWLRGYLRAIIFLGTPQRETRNLAWQILLLKLADYTPDVKAIHRDRFGQEFPPWVTENAEKLRKVPVEFRSCGRWLRILSFYPNLSLFSHEEPILDEHTTKLGLSSEKIICVPDRDVLSMASFTNKVDEYYTMILQAIKELANSPGMEPIFLPIEDQGDLDGEHNGQEKFKVTPEEDRYNSYSYVEDHTPFKSRKFFVD